MCVTVAEICVLIKYDGESGDTVHNSRKSPPRNLSASGQLAVCPVRTFDSSVIPCDVLLGASGLEHVLTIMSQMVPSLPSESVRTFSGKSSTAPVVDVSSLTVLRASIRL